MINMGPYADFILAAYGIALGALVLLGVQSWRKHQALEKDLAALKDVGAEEQDQ